MKTYRIIFLFKNAEQKILLQGKNAQDVDRRFREMAQRQFTNKWQMIRIEEAS